MSDVLTWIVLACWALWQTALWTVIFQPHNPRRARLYRMVCPAGLVGAVGVGVGIPLWALPFAVIQIAGWYLAHHDICRHDHTRRLRDAASGLVRRAGNRLVVAAAPITSGS